jgi:hypothetical protein
MKTVEFNLELLQDDTPIRGNAMASGDDDVDRRYENKIIAALEDGNDWMWANVRMTASVDIDECWDSLHCCVYENRADFEDDRYYFDMKDEALRLLRIEHEEALKAIGRAKRDLRAERAIWEKRQAEYELWLCPDCDNGAAVHPDTYVETGCPYCADCDREMERKDDDG